MECSICYNINKKCKLACGHEFCYKCIANWCKHCIINTCPFCRNLLKLDSKNTKEIIIEYNKYYEINKIHEDIMNFYKLKHEFSKKYIHSFDETKFIKSRPWCKHILTHESDTNTSTKYTFLNNKGEAYIKNILIFH